MAYVYLVASGFENISPSLNCLKRLLNCSSTKSLYYKPISLCIPHRAKNPTDMFFLDNMLIDINSAIASEGMCRGIYELLSPM